VRAAFRPSAASSSVNARRIVSSQCCSRRPQNHFHQYAFCSFSNNGTALNERRDNRPMFQYRILSSYKATKDFDHPSEIIPDLIEHFTFASRSQARKACRLGNIIVFRQRCDPGDQRNPFNVVDTEHTIQEGRILDWNDGLLLKYQNLANIRQGDLIAQVSREPNSELCYSEEMTKLVFPPALETPLNGFL